MYVSKYVCMYVFIYVYMYGYVYIEIDWFIFSLEQVKDGTERS